VATRRSKVRAELMAMDGVVEGPSGFSERDAYWVNGKEVAHFEADDVLEVRLTRAEIRARRAALRADPRVTLRASSSADWLEVRFSSAEDVAFAVSLASVAVEAHAGVGDPHALPPSGAALARRRRFH